MYPHEMVSEAAPQESYIVDTDYVYVEFENK